MTAIAYVPAAAAAELVDPPDPGEHGPGDALVRRFEEALWPSGPAVKQGVEFG